MVARCLSKQHALTLSCPPTNHAWSPTAKPPVETRSYGRIQSKVNGIHSAREARLRRNEVAAEIATQTEAEEAEAAAAAELMASDEQALDDLAQADLAYLQMVRHKLGHPGALTSSAEHLLAESWQQCARAALT